MVTLSLWASEKRCTCQSDPLGVSRVVGDGTGGSNSAQDPPEDETIDVKDESLLTKIKRSLFG